jgi:hypothetical protein
VLTSVKRFSFSPLFYILFLFDLMPYSLFVTETEKAVNADSFC